MRKSALVSIIVPVYNVEKYLRECLDSIINQTLKEIEIIVIDDGSTDSSPTIIDEYAKKDSRIISIHQKNKGYSYTINKGIKLAQGKYIGIVESDDFIDSNMYKSLLDLGLKYDADIIKGGFYKYNSFLPENKQKEYFFCPSEVDLRNAPQKAFTLEEWPKIIALHSSIWSSLYSSTLIKHCKVPESTGASYQDLPFMLTLMCAASRIAVDKTGYYYWRNEPNQQHSTSVKGEKALLMVHNSKVGIDIVKKSGKYNSLKEALFIQIFWANLPFLYNIEKKYRKTYYENLFSLLKPLKNDKNFKYQYFRFYDKLFFKLLLTGNYTLVYIGLSLAKTRRKLKHIISKTN